MPGALLFILVLFLLVGYFLSKKIFVEESKEEPSLLSEHPKGPDCESCGVEGCGGFAKALVRGGDNGPHGQKGQTACSLSNEAEDRPQDQKAFILCQGKNVPSRYHYTGALSCQAAAGMSIRPKNCRNACLGFGDCRRACRHQAIQIDEIARIDPVRCNGCRECIEACPVGLITMVPREAGIVIACKGMEPKGLSDIQPCPDGCTSCHQCIEVCEKGALLESEEGPPRLNPERCDGCGLCIEICPQGIIK